MGYLENSLPEYVLFTRLDQAINWARENSLFYYTLDLACCGIEMMHVAGARYDIERFGALAPEAPEHCDLMIVAGTITTKVAPTIKEMYDKMPFPKYVMSLGSCANSGGMFSSDISYSCVSGVDILIPVDVYVPGCPPRPEAILHGLINLQRKINGTRVLVRDELLGRS